MKHHYAYPVTPEGITANASFFAVKDPWSALTHFIGFLYSILLTPVMLIHASAAGASVKAMISLGIFMLSMILLFGASTAYHTFLVSPAADKRLKKMDHSMIFILIAGSYTPVCTCIVEPSLGLPLLAIVWGIAILGIFFKLCWVTCPRWVSSVIYIAMGWSCLLVMPELYRLLHGAAFNLLFLGGLFYTVGGVIYALKLKKLNEISPDFGSHEIFHVCVMLGSLCHYAVMYMYVR